jgi:UDP-N-acetylmuramate--alanine ligase
LGAFQGTGRRFEVLGEVAGIVVIDDYAHHPSEIRATLAGARSRFTGRSLWAVWQPHTYSRTQLFFDDFAKAFKDADHVLVTEVYGAREKSSTGFSAERIVKVMDHPDAHFIHGVREATEYLLNQLKSGDVLLVLSAGDGNQISANIVESLSIDRSAAHA